MKDKKSKFCKNTGITLVALVITIIILLILAGLSISALTESGLFQKAEDAVNRYGNVQNQENSILGEYENYIDNLESTGNLEGSNVPKIKIGDYINYTPDTPTSKQLTALNTAINTHSGSSTAQTLSQTAGLKWRILELDETGTKPKTLISANTTN